MLLRYFNTLDPKVLFLLIILLTSSSSETHGTHENAKLLVDPNKHLNLLFSKYESNDTICEHGLEKLIVDIRNPTKRVR